ncbi:hypothetical protein F5148DRAFT_1315259 [Russula earlei]|uniref:Uncharacterized protein n=1 Tax=Russula earlei TaxID=71964 RepID=A0ACC0UJI2_9AGAM|nr:hypothetical protein F5148DRAFT_1315259 [Russula earlei]
MESHTFDSNHINHSIRDNAAPPRQSPSTKDINHGHLRGDLPPSPARFLNQPKATNSRTAILASSPSGFAANLLTPSGLSTSVDAITVSDTTLNIASGSGLHPTGLHFRDGSGNARKAKAATPGLLHPDSYDHAPISAPTVFSHNAAALSLPLLDKYISSLPRPPFSSSSRSKTGTKVERFAPLDRLAILGRSLESLETNYKPKPVWRNCNLILGGVVNTVLGITGSSALATFYSLKGLFNTVQIFALILATIGHNVLSDWRQVFLGTIPNILALNFAPVLIQSIILLIILMALAGLLLYVFHVSIAPCKRYDCLEGFQRPDRSHGRRIVITSFLLTIIYLPLSTMAVHVITWSDDLWAVPNPYVNSTTNPPTVVPLGPLDQFRDPLDFCYTTTMKKNELNFAPAVFIMAVLALVALTISYPLVLRRIIKQSVPIVDRFTELGKPRSISDMNREYQRLLERDQSPLNFLYSGYRRDWAAYESLYLFMKFTALLIVAVIDPDNCLFRTFSRMRIIVFRQVLLLVVTAIFFAMQWAFSPFRDPVNNASEWVSRLNYVLTSLVALLVALGVPGKDVINGPILYIDYFLIINLDIVQRLVKRLAGRIDFSALDISSSSPHTRRRIWQEAITALFLTSPECKIPYKQPIYYIQARNSEFPPYLVNFQVLCHFLTIVVLKDLARNWHNCRADSTEFIGPDCFWRSPSRQLSPGSTRHFGNAWWLPFPPALVLRYDDGPLAVLNDLADFEQYLVQNSESEIQRRREIRIALRALDGQKVHWPYLHVDTNDTSTPWCLRGMRYKAQASTYYETGILNIKRKGYLVWDGLQVGSGFDVEIVYDKHVRVDGAFIGINDEYELTPALARFFAQNHALIHSRVSGIEALLTGYRQYFQQECRAKAETLSYGFLLRVYDHPRDSEGLAQYSIKHERDLRVKQLLVSNEAAFRVTYERLVAVSTTEVATWWYILWDDLWRRNADTINKLRQYASDFDPHYPSSIAYSPLPRAALENFLTQRGLLHNKRKRGDFIDNGFLNKVYIRMYDIVFHRSSETNIFHLGYDTRKLDMEDVDLETQVPLSTLGTGGGTDHDDPVIRPRPVFRWEGILSDPLVKKQPGRNFLSKLGVWLGLTPFWRTGTGSLGVALDVHLEGDKYILSDNLQDDWRS